MYVVDILLYMVHECFIKGFLGESETGFLLNALVYCGDTYPHSDRGPIYGAVWELLSRTLVPGAVDFLNQGYQVSKY